jgi:hypothetical protein
MEGDNAMNDVDIEMARCTSIAKGLANARKAGHCSHEKRRRPMSHVYGAFMPTQWRCDDCGKVSTWAELDEDRREILIEWT